jgi:hypothetical protein
MTHALEVEQLDLETRPDTLVRATHTTPCQPSQTRSSSTGTRRSLPRRHFPLLSFNGAPPRRHCRLKQSPPHGAAFHTQLKSPRSTLQRAKHANAGPDRRGVESGSTGTACRAGSGRSRDVHRPMHKGATNGALLGWSAQGPSGGER